MRVTVSESTDMQLARSLFERVTSQTILPMVTLGFSGAIATAMVELFNSWRAEFANVRTSRRLR